MSTIVAARLRRPAVSATTGLILIPGGGTTTSRTCNSVWYKLDPWTNTPSCSPKLSRWSKSRNSRLTSAASLRSVSNRSRMRCIRIWLGRANLAIRAGSYDEARRWIDDCLRRRPDDRAVWRAQLGWSMRTNRRAEARAALTHLPAELATPAEVHRLSAWMASGCGDMERERHELAALVAEAPEDFEALERLEKLEQQQSAKTAAGEPRRRRVEIERDQLRYRELYRRNQPARDALKMARLAERLGHRFEAILFLTAAMAEEPDRADLRENLHRLEEAAHEPNDRSQSLFDRLPKHCGGDEPRSGVPAGRRSSVR